jgi:hypothetical protein
MLIHFSQERIDYTRAMQMQIQLSSYPSGIAVRSLVSGPRLVNRQQRYQRSLGSSTEHSVGYHAYHWHIHVGPEGLVVKLEIAARVRTRPEERMEHIKDHSTSFRYSCEPLYIPGEVSKGAARRSNACVRWPERIEQISVTGGLEFLMSPVPILQSSGE